MRIEKEGSHVDSSMDRLWSHTGLSGWRVSRTLQAESTGQDEPFKIEERAVDAMKCTRNKTFAVIARLRGLPEGADELRRHLRQLVTLTRAEIGCLSCELIENSCDPTEFTLLEEWSSERAHDAHLGAEPIQSAMKTVHGSLSSEFDSHKHALGAHAVRYGANSYCPSVG
jgi:quinol monooxygenase YgiN